MIALPTRIAHYDVSGLLGDGAASYVVAAEHRVTGRSVAIKLPRPELARNEDVRARMRLEGRVLGRVRGHHIVDALDAGTTDDGAPFLVLERLDGPTLAVQIAHDVLPFAATIAIGEALLEALSQLHAASIVHRDVKPANVLLHHDADVVVPKLIDLGVCLDARTDPDARRTSQGAWVGTPCYMAPEQLVAREATTARSDVYAVGALLYECLTGGPPHDGATASEVATRTLSEPALPVGMRRADCPRALERVIARALSGRARDRYASADAMRAALEQVRRGLRLPSGSEALAELTDVRGLPIPLRRRASPEAVTVTIPKPTRGIAAIVLAAAFATACLARGDVTEADARSETPVAQAPAVHHGTPPAPKDERRTSWTRRNGR